MSKTLDEKISPPGDSYFLDLSRGEALKIQDEVRMDEAVLRGQIHTYKQIYAVDSKEIERLTDLTQEKDARIAELTAEVASLRVVVTQGYEEGFKAGIQYQAAEDDAGLDYWTAWNKSIARNALKEGV